MIKREDILSPFQSCFGNPEIEVFAPGRANIIGEHTDYNDGFVLPFAIRQGVWFFARKSAEVQLDILACNTQERAVLHCDGTSAEAFQWQKFFRQVVQACHGLPMPGLSIAFGGNLPIGAGISSSSAITCGLIQVLNLAGNWHLSPMEMVQLAVRAEVGYGVRGGIMDQYTIFHGRRDQAILLDCRTNTATPVLLNPGSYAFLLINTNVKHNLIDTDYNNRRAQCEEALFLIQKEFEGVTSLRDITLPMLNSLAPRLPEVLHRRVTFVVEENTRVLRAVKAITSGDFEQLGSLLQESHTGLSTQYEVSCPELDWLASLPVTYSRMAGSRMMGGGFGGCTITILKSPLTSEEVDLIKSDYVEKFGLAPAFIPISPENGIMENFHILQ